MVMTFEEKIAFCKILGITHLFGKKSIFVNLICITFQFATYLVDAFCRGIFAGKSSELSIKSCFPHLFEIEQKYGSLILGSLLSKREGKSFLVSIKMGDCRHKIKIFIRKTLPLVQAAYLYHN